MMQWNNTKGERGSLSPFLWLFFIVGIVLAFFVGDDESYKGIFSAAGISSIKLGSFNGKSFLIHVLLSRLSYIVGVILLSTTSLRKLFLFLQPALLCLGIGGWIGVSISQFGIKGVLLVLAGAFPHMLVYLLVLHFLIMLLWERTYYDKQFFIAVLIIFFITTLGCLVESYVNPFVVAKILKIF